ncbi:methionyl-tRNA formyltransferase, mitochondrial isoform X3 [Mobula hypostoma]|uniref:methionyl-tRNA formyltransferase, mitochondrial isoform X3 n=1 Tax=Mobula hypostoma TaxID=723540 RepID=UPI002FC3B2C4
MAALRRTGRAWAAASAFLRFASKARRWVSGDGGRRVRVAPPWRILFFGTDAFAQRTLQEVHSSLCDGNLLIERLEVVTLPDTKYGELPVRRYARLNEITLHDWPCLTECHHFDVGIVVSFGVLLSDTLIEQFPYGILNLHPSLLPRWRGPAPIFHTLIHGDQVTGVTIMQIRPKRFDIGPILSQQKTPVPPRCTADELGVILAEKGAEMLLSVLRSLPEHVENRREQSKEGVTFDATPDQLIPGTAHFHKELKVLFIRCKNGWTGFRQVLLKKQLTAADFYNGYLHPYFRGAMVHQSVARFQTHKPRTKIKKMPK